METFRRCKVEIIYGIWGSKLRLRIKIHPRVALNVSNSELRRQSNIQRYQRYTPPLPSADLKNVLRPK